MSTASETTLQLLHDLLAKEYAKQLREGQQVVTKEGDVVHASPSPALLTSVAKFLNDNGIKCDRGFPSKSLQETQAALKDLPFSPDQESKH